MAKRNTPRCIRLVFLVRSLCVGGAERQLVTLAKRLDRRLFDVTVLSFYSGGEFFRDLGNAGVPVISLRKKGRWDIPVFLSRFMSLMRSIKPDLLYSYMTGANLVATLVKATMPQIRLVWGVRSSNVDCTQSNDWLVGPLARLEASLSRFPDLIIFNSHAGRVFHSLAGFRNPRLAVIPNGTDTDAFKPDSASRSRLRARWHLANDSFLITAVARLDPMKDHRTFLQAAHIISRQRSDVTFACIGAGPKAYARELRDFATELAINDNVLWESVQPDDMPGVYNASDIVTCASAYGEGTSNAICEAMACGVPCVVTDVGDLARTVGSTGLVVPPANPEALATAWNKLLHCMTTKPQMLPAPRQFIQSRLSLSAMVHKTSTTLMDLYDSHTASDL